LLKIFNYANCILYGFIRILFYILAFYYIFKFLAKLLLPLIVKKSGKESRRELSAAARKGTRNFLEGQSRDEIIYNDSN
jgi:hypothetical protein